jgi:flagellar basal body rod protein FlgC
MQNIEKADLPRDTVGMIIAEKGVGANVAALKAANKMYDNLLDILA